jgi:hypothetical protein
MEAGVPKGQAWVLIAADGDERVEHGRRGSDRDIEVLEVRLRIPGLAAMDAQPGRPIRDASRCVHPSPRPPV